MGTFVRHMGRDIFLNNASDLAKKDKSTDNAREHE